MLASPALLGPCPAGRWLQCACQVPAPGSRCRHHDPCRTQTMLMMKAAEAATPGCQEADGNIIIAPAGHRMQNKREVDSVKGQLKLQSHSARQQMLASWPLQDTECRTHITLTVLKGSSVAGRHSAGSRWHHHDPCIPQCTAYDWEALPTVLRTCAA
jgi:hypothetical protein